MTLFVKWLNRAPIGRSSVRSSYQTRPVLNKRLWLALPIWLNGRGACSDYSSADLDTCLLGRYIQHIFLSLAKGDAFYYLE